MFSGGMPPDPQGRFADFAAKSVVNSDVSNDWKLSMFHNAQLGR
jgi:hypothetical protein